MFDAEDDDLERGICRDEDCKITHVHRAHVFMLGEAKQRGRRKRPWWLKTDPTAHQRPDPVGLDEAIRRVFQATMWPLAFRDILNAVRNDYGSVAGRTLSRHLSEIVGSGFLRALDLRLTYLAYIRADSRFVDDHERLREYMLDQYGAIRERPRRRAAPALELRWAVAS